MQVSGLVKHEAVRFDSQWFYPGVAKLGIALGSGPRGRGFKSRHSDQLRLLKKMQPLKPLLRQGFQPFQREKSSTSRDGDAKGHFRDVV